MLDDGRQASVQAARVSTGYFDAFGIDVRAGRDFTLADIDSGSGTIVNQAFVDRYWDGLVAVGRPVRRWSVWSARPGSCGLTLPCSSDGRWPRASP
jgi:hypothetical protein